MSHRITGAVYNKASRDGVPGFHLSRALGCCLQTQMRTAVLSWGVACIRPIAALAWMYDRATHELGLVCFW
jgi:hypothetical protein